MEVLIKNIEDNSVVNYYTPLLKKREPKKFLISVIIPVMGRITFLKPLIETLNIAIKKSGKKINITIVEHSENELFKATCKELNINYYWIKKNKTELFNKSLCHNIGAILNKNSDNFLFHDLDCLVFDDFFIKIIEMIEKNEIAFQTFKNRRLLYLTDELTKDIIDKKISITDIDINDDKIKKGHECAPGGSICVNKNIFVEVGGFDPELFDGHAPEDLFFWDKISFLTKMGSMDNEILHMCHERLDNTNDRLEYMLFHVQDFNNSTEVDKTKLLYNKKNMLNKFMKIN